MSRSNVKYEIAREDPEGADYYLQHVQDFHEMSKSESRGLPFLVCIVAVYFSLSVGLTFYQQWLYRTHDYLPPLSVVICHLIVKMLLACAVRAVRGCTRRRQQVRLQWHSILTSLAIPGVASGLDVGLSNWGMSLITLSLYTMTKSTSIIFILGFSLLFKLEKKSLPLVGVVGMISGGLFMFTYKSVQFNGLGFSLCLFAAFSSGIRWTMAQLVMQKNKLGIRDSVDMMYYMQPWMFLAILPFAIFFESGKLIDLVQSTDWSNAHQISTTATAVLAGAILAFCMEVMEFVVVTFTSSLTLSITGITKEVSILILGYELNGDKLTALNFMGLLMCLCGIIMHVIQKAYTRTKENMEKLELQSNSVTTNDSVSDEPTESNVPLLSQRSTSLTNLRNSNFSSDDEDNKERVLLDVRQRREQS